MKSIREWFANSSLISSISRIIRQAMTSLREWHAGFSCRSNIFVRRNALSLISLGLLICLVLVFFFDRIFISIRPGELGVLWRLMGTGTVIDTVYREGMHVVLPFNKMYVYNMRKQQFNETIDVLTLDGLTLKVKYTARYYLEKDTLPMLHQRVGPDYVSVVVRPDVRSVIRTWFGQYKPEEIYTSQTAIQLRVSEQSKVRMAARFVTLDDVLIEGITLPTRISEAIESKLFQQQLEAGYIYRISIAQKEAERLRIESAGLRLYNDTVTQSLTPSVLKWHGIKATEELAKSPNAKVVVIGAGNAGLPLILGRD
jgi:regulator of protease activity HflC (stomatin/prohibitin superfamily)